MSEPKKRIKLKQSRVNLYPEQHELLKNLAKENGTNVSEYIRQKLNLNVEKEARKEYKKHDEIIVKKADPKLLYELAKIGNNLNQIAKHINTTKSIEKIDLLKVLVSIENKMKELI